MSGESIQGVLAQAKALAGDGNLTEATAVIEELQRRHPGVRQLHPKAMMQVGRGFVLLRDRQFEDALQLFKQAESEMARATDIRAIGMTGVASIGCAEALCGLNRFEAVIKACQVVEHRFDTVSEVSCCVWWAKAMTWHGNALALLGKRHMAMQVWGQVENRFVNVSDPDLRQVVAISESNRVSTALHAMDDWFDDYDAELSYDPMRWLHRSDVTVSNILRDYFEL